MQGLFNIPQIKAFGIKKGENVIIFDDIFEKQVHALPAIDFSGGQPVFPSTLPLQKCFPDIISDNDVKTKKKYLVKELVWRGFLGKEILPDHTIVPINYQQTDLRSDNLVLLPGSAKNFKGVQKFTVPEDIEFEYKFFPNGVSLVQKSTSAINPWTLYIKTSSMDKRKSILCSPKHFQECFNKVKKMLIEDNTY